MRYSLPLLLPAAVAALMLAGCGECPVFENAPSNNLQVREATITRFNPSFLPDSTPAPSYSIHTFAFPTSDASSGDLPNDNRFRTQSGQVVLGILEYSNPFGEERTVRVSTGAVDNSRLNGDIMVVSVSLGPPRTARLRFRREVATISPPLLTSASASDFVAYVQGNAGTSQQVDGLAATASRYGANLGNASSSSNPSIRVDVLGSNGQVTGDAVPAALQPAVDSIAQSSRIVEVEVRLGEVYYYKAESGQEFAVLIEDIFEGSQSPNLQRVTIKYIDLRTEIPTDCEAS